MKKILCFIAAAVLVSLVGRQLPLDFYSGAVGPHRIADKPMKN